MKNFDNPYEPCLSYVRQFDPTKGDMHTVVVDYELISNDNKTFAKQRKETIRKFQGENVLKNCCIRLTIFTLSDKIYK
jgi:hypothetical protein